MSMRSILAASFLALSLAACGGGSDTSNTTTTTGTGAGGGSGGSGAGGGGAGGSGGTTTASTSSSTSGTGTTPGGIVDPKAVFKTVVIVGDSISDVGAGGKPGQQPYYYKLLEQNDDTLYPEWAGHDMKSLWGSAFTVVKVSKGGSQAPDLINQIHGLPATLEGPVLIVGTIGGNDVRGALLHYFTGGAAALAQDAATYGSRLATAFAEIAQPDRFGPGVKATALIANIYDPSDGNGDFTFVPEGQACPLPLGLFPKGTPTTPLLQPFLDAMATEAGKVQGVLIPDLHSFYMGHGVNRPDPDNWFYPDCIHPDSTGHAHIRELFWSAIAAL